MMGIELSSRQKRASIECEDCENCKNWILRTHERSRILWRSDCFDVAAWVVVRCLKTSDVQG